MLKNKKYFLLNRFLYSFLFLSIFVFLLIYIFDLRTNFSYSLLFLIIELFVFLFLSIKVLFCDIKIKKNLMYVSVILNLFLLFLFKLNIISILYSAHIIVYNIFLFLLLFSYSQIKNEKSFNNNNKKDRIFLLLLLLFISLKSFIVFFYNGSYIDEYTHIFSGKNLIEHAQLPYIYDGTTYIRGLLASILSAFSLFVSNNSIVVVKVFFSFIGVINFIILYKIAKKIISNKYVIYLLLIVYSISPWIIFEHFYIRFYIFYELFILLITLYSIKIIESKKEMNYKNIRKNLFYFFIINLIMNALIFDAGRLMITLYSLSLITFIYIYILDFEKNEKHKPDLFQKLLEIEKSKKEKIVYGFGVFVAILIIFLLLTKIIHVPVLLYSSAEDLKYINLFFNLNIISSVIFISTFIYVIFDKLLKNNSIKNEITVVVISVFILFLINMLIPTNLQNTRSILYFFSLYYLVIFLGLDFLVKNRNKIELKIIILFGIVVAEVFLSYPKGFISTPFIPKEIDYIDNSAYRDARNICYSNIVIVYSNPGIATFWGIKPDFYINSKYSDNDWVLNNGDSKLGYKKNGEFFDVYSNVKIISTVDELEYI